MKVLLPVVKQEFTDSEDDEGNSSDFSTSTVNSAIASGNSRANLNEFRKALSFANLDGVHTGVPTKTTPTITPTTLRSIEETFIELQRETERQESHPNEAGFVPPPLAPATLPSAGKGALLNWVDNKAYLGGSTTVIPTTAIAMNRSSTTTSVVQMPALQPLQPQTRRNMGGRRPNKNTGLSAEEEERRQVRRERNKLAAARCRKRRLDHTNELLMETDELECKRSGLKKDIEALQIQKRKLEFLLEAHKNESECRLNDPILMDDPISPPEFKPMIYVEELRVQQQQQQQPRFDAATLSSHHFPLMRRPQHAATAGVTKPSRPSSLSVTAKPLEVAGIPITTPSTVIPFNFESLMEGGTGLTPVSSTGLSPIIPSCSSQQRNQVGIELASPDSTTCPPKLVSL